MEKNEYIRVKVDYLEEIIDFETNEVLNGNPVGNPVTAAIRIELKDRGQEKEFDLQKVTFYDEIPSNKYANAHSIGKIIPFDNGNILTAPVQFYKIKKHK